jgi:hypothetical protein
MKLGKDSESTVTGSRSGVSEGGGGLQKDISELFGVTETVNFFFVVHTFVKTTKPHTYHASYCMQRFFNKDNFLKIILQHYYQNSVKYKQ